MSPQMPTVPERLASLEVRAAHIEVAAAEIRDDVKELASDVKELLAWRDEERGARAQRQLDWKRAGVGLTVLTIIINIFFNLPTVGI